MPTLGCSDGSERPRVLVLATTFPRWPGDYAGKFIWDVALENVRHGAEVRVVAPHAPGSRLSESMDGVEVRRFRYMWPARFQRLAYGGGILFNLRNSIVARLELPLFFLSFLARTLWVVRWADIVHAHWPLCGVIAVLLGRLFRKRVVVTFYGIEVFTKTAHPISAFCIRHADHLIGISTATLSAAQSIERPKASSVIPFGVRGDFASRADTSLDVRRRHGVDPAATVLFSLGRLIERKGTKYLIRAMPRLLQEGPVHLLIGGEGPERRQLESTARELGVLPHVSFIGPVSSEELSSYYEQCDIFVHPVITDATGDVEGLGIVLLEAMSLGRPVIASAIGGITDIVVDGETGYLVPEKHVEALAARVSTLIRNADVREVMGVAAKRRVDERFRVENLARVTMQLYSTLTKPPQPTDAATHSHLD